MTQQRENATGAQFSSQIEKTRKVRDKKHLRQ
jgi:hypothetical protein